MRRKQALYVEPGDLVVIDGVVWAVIRTEQLHVWEWYCQLGLNASAFSGPPNMVKLELRSLSSPVQVLNVFRGWHEIVKTAGVGLDVDAMRQSPAEIRLRESVDV